MPKNADGPTLDIRAAVERLKAADGSLRATAALRIAVRALQWYARPQSRRFEDGGRRAHNAIKRIERQLDPDQTPSPLAETEER